MEQHFDRNKIGTMAQQSQKPVTPRHIWICLSDITKPQNGRTHSHAFAKLIGTDMGSSWSGVGSVLQVLQQMQVQERVS